MMSEANIPKGHAKFILLNVTGSEDNLSMYEITEVSEMVSSALGDENSNLIWGADIDNTLKDVIRLSIWIRE